MLKKLYFVFGIDLNKSQFFGEKTLKDSYNRFSTWIGNEHK